MKKKYPPLKSDEKKELQSHINDIAEMLDSLNRKYSSLRYKAVEPNTNDVVIHFTYALGEMIRDGIREVVTSMELLERASNRESVLIIHPRHVPKDVIP